MKTLLEVLNLSTEFLSKKGISNPRRQAQDLLCDALGLARVDLYMQYDRPMTNNELEVLRDKIARRAQGEPLAYIHGEVLFYQNKFLVNKNVLIPRQETEILVDKIANDLARIDLKDKVLWDVCTGSGCIGISLKKKFPELTVYLADICSQALIVAKENANKNNVEVFIVEGDFFTPFEGLKTDFIVCNPPYVSIEEYKDLDREVANFEPKKALVAEGEGLHFYRKLALEAPCFLNEHGKVWLEIGTGQAEELTKIFSSYPWKDARSERDWAGHDRFFFLEIE